MYLESWRAVTYCIYFDYNTEGGESSVIAINVNNY